MRAIPCPRNPRYYSPPPTCHARWQSPRSDRRSARSDDRRTDCLRRVRLLLNPSGTYPQAGTQCRYEFPPPSPPHSNRGCSRGGMSSSMSPNGLNSSWSAVPNPFAKAASRSTASPRIRRASSIERPCHATLFVSYATGGVDWYPDHLSFMFSHRNPARTALLTAHWDPPESLRDMLAASGRQYRYGHQALDIVRVPASGQVQIIQKNDAASPLSLYQLDHEVPAFLKSAQR